MGARSNIQKVTAVDMFIVQLMAEDSALDKYIKPRVSVSWYINIKRLFDLLIILEITCNKFYNFNVINRQLFGQMI